jgi:hypothetical protein
VALPSGEAAGGYLLATVWVLASNRTCAGLWGFVAPL